jgi:UDP-N-acetylglucosamine 1-carboxyvinyltransferase
MSKLSIEGGEPLFGELTVQGSKNAALPIIAGTLLQNERCVLCNIPMITDVYAAIEILRYLGVTVLVKGHTLEIEPSTINKTTIPLEYMEKMRSSVLFMGVLLARCGQVKAFKPGGCSIGTRPIDFHLEAFRQFGANVVEQEEQIEISCENLKSGVCKFPIPSVGATENALLVAARIDGNSYIENAAREPEVMELCWFLESMGCQIEGIGTSRLLIRGNKDLKVTDYYYINSDRIVAGTYLGACMMSGGKICLKKCPVCFIGSTLRLFTKLGAQYSFYEDTLVFSMKQRPNYLSYLETAPYPEFATDMQSVLMAILAIAKGESVLCETIFENRMRVAKELNKMGAKIEVDKSGRMARIVGVSTLEGCKVMATDLRSGAALVVAGLSASGETIVDGYRHIARGYEDIVKDLVQLGGRICLTE